MRAMTAKTSRRTVVVVVYADDDKIWQLPKEKQERQCLADAQRDIAMEADERTQEKITERG